MTVDDQNAELHAPVFRRLWVVVTLTVLLLTFPVALLILLTGPVYKRAADGAFTPISNKSRYIYAGVLGLWLVAVVAKSIIAPDYSEYEQTAGPNPSKFATAPAADDQCRKPAIPQGTNYSTARATIMDQGYLPAATSPSDGSYCADPNHSDICKKLPEIDDCSGSGYCKMAFATKAGHTAEVILFGDGPGDESANVQSVTYQCKADQPAPSQPVAPPASEPELGAPECSDPAVSAAVIDGVRDAYARVALHRAKV